MTGSIKLGQKFKTIDELYEAINKYMREQHVPYTIFNSTKAETHNRDHPKHQMPLEQEYKMLVVACKHYNKPRKSQHKPGTKKRVNQSTFKKYCIAKFNTNYVEKGQYHEITKLEENHCNHIPDPNLAGHYPEFRRPSVEIMEKVNMLFENEAKPHRIRDVVLNSGVLATGQDIQNLRNRWRSTLKGGKDSVEEALFGQLDKLKEEDQNSVVAVLHDEETKIIQSVFFQTSYMRESLELFPELVVMDTTYQLCENDMPLIVYSVVDCFGKGRIAGYCLIFSETKELVTASLKILKLGHPELSEKVKVVYIDKAQSEVAAIHDILPKAEIHLCDFHVKEIFNRNNVKKLAEKCNWDEIEEQIEAMRFAHTKQDYDTAYTQLIEIAGGKDSPFMKYFTKNWHNSRLVWSDYQRNESFTLGERTTGRVESHNAKIKKMIDRKLPVPEVILRLCVLNRNSAIENSQRVFNEVVKSKYHKYSDDIVIQHILKLNTPFVGAFLKAQYERSLEPPSASVHNVTLDTCDCKYYNQSHLVCSHIFRERRLKGVEIYDHKLIPARWTVILPSPSEEQNFENFEIITSPVKTSKSKKVLTQEDRYNLADSISKRICSFIANFGGDQFHSYINSLKDFEDLVRVGKRIVVVGVNGEGQLDNLQFITSDPVENSSASPDAVEANTTAAPEIEPPNQGVNIFGVETLQRDVLKLPQKCPVPGQPKGKRKYRGKKKKVPITQSIDPDDEESNVDDDVGPVSETTNNLCDVCNGPVLYQTSCSKKNQGKMFISCKNLKSKLCANFRREVESSDNAAGINKNKSTMNVTRSPPICACGDECLLRKTLDGRVYYGCWKHQCHISVFVKESADLGKEHQGAEDDDIIVLSSDSESEPFKTQPLIKVEHTSENPVKLVDYESSFDEGNATSIVLPKDCSNVTIRNKRKASSLPSKSPFKQRRCSSGDNISEFGDEIFTYQDNISDKHQTPKRYYIPKCCCKVAATRKSSTNQGGRNYFVCPDGKCKYFRWADTLYNLAPSPNITDSSPLNTIDIDSLLKDGEEVFHDPCLDDNSFLDSFDKDNLLRKEEEVSSVPSLNVDVSCPMCAVEKPSPNGAHKCALCGQPVHAFGCSVLYEGGVEGSGGTDRVCIPCSKKGPPLGPPSNDPLLDEILGDLNALNAAEQEERVGRPFRHRKLPTRIRKSYLIDETP